MSASDAEVHAGDVLANLTSGATTRAGGGATNTDRDLAVGTGLGAAMSSFGFFASGAPVPSNDQNLWMSLGEAA